MRIDVSPYELVARAEGRRRTGALLQVTFDNGVRGYGDVHPWPELGDAPLDRQLAALAEGRPESLGARSLELARADGEARAEGRSLFAGLTVPPSHLSLPFGFRAEDLGRAKAEGYSRVKLKGWDFTADDLYRFRASGLRFRLDFNAHLDADRVTSLLDDWDDLGWIDWLEDPCPYDADAWRALRERVRLGIDFETAEPGGEFDVRVVKPARDAFPPPAEPFGIAYAFTSYLDHPVGQLAAAWLAARAVAEGFPVEAGGLLTHEAYEPTVFSRSLSARDARLIPPGGLGLGFGREMEALQWRRLEA